MKGIDCVTRLNAKTAATAKSLGFSFVGRYLVPPGMNKELTRAEAEAICAAGLGILTVWETYANRAVEGELAGAVDGAKAYQCAREIAMPENGTIYFAVDFEASGYQMDSIASYLKAARAQTGPYKVGIYGSYAVCEGMHERIPDVCQGYWQCVAWSYGKLSPHRTIYQREWSGAPEALAAKAVLGFGVDINDCSDLEAAGIWLYPADDPAPATSLVDTLSNEDAYKLFQKAQAYAAALPEEWGAVKPDSLKAAVDAKITDGSRPLAFCTRAEAAMMALRAREGGR